jgi:predicted GNAT superfamily acetyltransferase
MLEITLENLRHFSDSSVTMVTVDAPLFGVVMIMHGQVIVRGSHEADKVGASLGFPPRDQIIAEASRFWIQHANGVRERKNRDEMAKLLRDYQRAAGVS